jgi:hypothetical protein
MKVGKHHLTYCTNIHPGETWPEVFANLQQYLPPLKSKLSPDSRFGVGLRLADVASRSLEKPEMLMAFQDWLTAQDLYVFTLNGFPYSSFHHTVVKDRVYAPDWQQPDRLTYTQRLIKILTKLLPDGMEGSISTLPLSYKPWFEDPAALHHIYYKSVKQLVVVAADLIEVYESTGKLIHLGLEPEPDGLLENTSEVIQFFNQWLLPLGGELLADRLGISVPIAQDALRNHLRVCYDTCHFAIEFEHPTIAFQQLQDEGIKVSKIQLSSAIKLSLPAPGPQRQRVRDRLMAFTESTYLHQVIAKMPDGSLYRYRDLCQALEVFDQTPAIEWRTHFHVPIFLRDYPLLNSTQDHILETIGYLQSQDLGTHLEIETYTWDVLPMEMKFDLVSSIEREYEWVKGVLN